jgi:hypothetical protein
MKAKELSDSKVPTIIFDTKLNKFRDKVLFPEKLEKANKILAESDLPDLYYKLLNDTNTPKKELETVKK